MTPRRRKRANEKLPPYVYKRRGCYVVGEYDPETQRVRYSRLCADNASLNDIWEAYNARQKQARDTLSWVGATFKKSTQYTQLAASTRHGYDYAIRVIEDTKTKEGASLAEIPLSKWSSPLVQKVVDKTAATRGPSSARHVAAYLKRLFRWAKNRGHVARNHATGVELPTERKRRRLPTPEVYAALLQYAKTCGDKPARSAGSCPPYLWIIMELNYLLRQRSIESNSLTDAHKTDDGILVDRRKGSRGNTTRWNDRLRAAWAAAEEYRQKLIDKRSLPVPMRPEDRALFITSGGTPLQRSSLDSAWQRLITRAIEDGVITEDQRFGLRDLKRKGITDTKGTRADKREASGHKSEQMMDIYDHSLPVVDATDD